MNWETQPALWQWISGPDKRAFAFVDVHESNCLNASRETAVA